MDIAKFKEEAKDLGYVDDEFRAYVEKRISQREKDELERERRLEERNDRKEKEQREHELKMKELELKIAQQTMSTTQPQSKTNVNKLPKIPYFDPTTDNLDTYLTRFENVAQNAKWNEEEKYIGLSNLLKSEALEVLNNLRTEEQNYVALKKALLSRFKYTEEGFRQRFKTYKPHSEADFQTFLNTVINTPSGSNES